MRALLDINVLLALLDTDNPHRPRALSWLDAAGSPPWSTCALTENGFIRILSQPTYPNPVSAAAAADVLREAAEAGDHEFWHCDVSLLDPSVVRTDRVHGHRQITDTYLLALAVAHGGRFVTLDQRISLTAVPGATAEHLVVV
jgi:toxin-antitoxin system PIN domain toxin